MLILAFGRIPPVSNFAKIHARGPRGRLRIAPRDLIPPPPGARVCTQAMRLWLPPAPSSTVHTHSNEDIQQPTASLHTARQQPGNSSAPTTPCFGSHATRSLFFSTKARRFAHVWRVHALHCGRRATLQLSDTSQRSPKFAQILPSQLVPNLHSRFAPLPLPFYTDSMWHTGSIS